MNDEMYGPNWRGHDHMRKMAEARRRACAANKLTYCITCPKCGTQFNVICTKAAYEKGKYRHYCSRSCANGHVRTEESKSKVSQSLKKHYETHHSWSYGLIFSSKQTKRSNIIAQADILPPKARMKNGRRFYKRTCVVCGKEFETSRKQAECCSRNCVANKPGYRENLRKKALERVANGTHNGWNSRNISSYAERFWIKVLDNNDIPYHREYHLGKYFLDFYIEIRGRKIDLEIDGRQHKRQVEHDYIRDEFIKSQNIEVYRIEWNAINNEAGKNKMKAKIDAFLEYIKT